MSSENQEIKQIKELLKLHDYIIVKLPYFSQFRSKNKSDKSPYFKFYRWLSKKIDYKKRIDVTKIWLTKEDAKKLDHQVSSWIKNAYKLNKKNVSIEFAWHNLEFGPSVFTIDNKEEWMHTGSVYIHKSLLEE